MDGAKKTTYWLKWLVILIAPLLLQFIPTTATFTIEMRAFLSIATFTIEMRAFLSITVFGILMFIFDLVDTIVSSTCLMFGYALFQVAPLNVVLSSWTTNVPWIVFFSLVLVNIIQRTTLMKRMAYWCIVKTGGSYAGIIYGLTTLGIITNLLVPSTLAGVALIGIAFGICQALELGISRASADIMIVIS